MNSSTLHALGHPLVLALIGLAVLALWRNDARRPPYLLCFGLSYLAYGIGVTAQIVLIPAHHASNVVFSGLMYMLAALLFARGLINLSGAAYRPAVPLAIFLLSLALRVYVVQIDDNGAMRASCLHGSIFLLFLHAAYAARRLRHGLQSEMVTYYAFVLFTVTTPLKLLLTAARPANSYGFDFSSYWAVTTISIYAFGLVFSLALLITIVQRNRQAKQATDENLSLISHDLRAPLATIVGNLHLLQQTATPEQMAHLDAIERSTQYQNLLIDDLAAGEQAAHPLRVNPALMDMGTFLAELCLHGRAWCTQHSNVFSLRLLTALPSQICTDERRLKQILLNLLSNAVLATRNGRVQLRVARLNDEPGRARIRFEVLDTGDGIDASQQSQLFEAYQRFDLQRPGTGLGLYIAQRIADNLEGVLDVQSEPGKGSCFSLTLRVPAPGTDTLPAGWQPAPARGDRHQTSLDLPNSFIGGHTAQPETPGHYAPPKALCRQLASYAAQGRYTDIQDWISQEALKEPCYKKFRAAVQIALDHLDFNTIEALAKNGADYAQCAQALQGKTCSA